MAAAIALGTALVALTLFGVQTLMAGAPASATPVTSGPAPLLLLVVDWLRTRASCANAREDDVIEAEDAPVIIAGTPGTFTHAGGTVFKLVLKQK